MNRNSNKWFTCLILFSLSLIVLTNCTESITTPDNSTSYMPLKVGNKWYYSTFRYGSEPSLDNITEIWEVIGTKVIEEKNVYVITKTFPQSYIPDVDTMYYFCRGNTLFQLIKNPAQVPYITCILADFNLRVNEKYTTMDRLLVYEVTVSEKSEDKMSFYFNSTYAYDEERSYTYQKDKGFYEMYSPAWGVRKRLVKAELK